MAYNQYDLANTGLAKIGTLTEMYIPLWWYSNSYISTTLTTNQFIQKGSSGTTTTSNVSCQLHTLSPNWVANQQFAFEASIHTNTTSYTAYAILYDITTNSVCLSSELWTSGTTIFQTFRSPKFTLNPGHIYGVVIYTSTSGGTAYLTKASLIAFLS